MELTIASTRSKIGKKSVPALTDVWDPFNTGQCLSYQERVMVGNANIWVQVHANDWYQILLWKQDLTGEGAGREVTTRARTLSEAAENQGREKGQYLKTSGTCFLSSLLFSLSTQFSGLREEQNECLLDHRRNSVFLKEGPQNHSVQITRKGWLNLQVPMHCMPLLPHQHPPTGHHTFPGSGAGPRNFPWSKFPGGLWWTVKFENCALEAKLYQENTDEHSLLKDLEENSSGKSHFIAFTALLSPYLKITWCIFLKIIQTYACIISLKCTNEIHNYICIQALLVSFPFLQGSHPPPPSTLISIGSPVICIVTSL